MRWRLQCPLKLDTKVHFIQALQKVYDSIDFRVVNMYLQANARIMYKCFIRALKSPYLQAYVASKKSLNNFFLKCSKIKSTLVLLCD